MAHGLCDGWASRGTSAFLMVPDTRECIAEVVVVIGRIGIDQLLRKSLHERLPFTRKLQIAREVRHVNQNAGERRVS